MSREQYFSNSYSVQIQNLVRLMVKMKLYTSKILRLTSLLFLEPHLEQKTKILEISKQIKVLGIELEDSVNKIIALSNPLAFDLRFLLFSIKISSELNEIAHLCNKTVLIVEKFGNKTLLESKKTDLMKMMDISRDTLKDVISVLLQFDSKKKADEEILQKIQDMLEVDDVVDLIYDKILQDGLKSIKEGVADPIIIFDKIAIAKNLEKISDCIYNMIITTKYILTGSRS
jgi:phosphate transport system protein